ncbi:hypothetical protein GCM10022243_02390 [Saccharothrix violaceirubra]|uniref:Excalibur calcium-binding domain-containing protein n=1 Tax=Saccharothrix violaceirubra TaxID=413306 RepID=A0A7W7T456_9PSEU|nr:hypothetical protein [Saccharothrix violaceirubra]MBB4965996.1 hypothetical protein [Saccharothrix violaceirubra]
MIENSAEGLYRLASEVTVAVTREDHHQDALSRYAVEPGQERHVAAELGWCVVAAGKHRGERAVEVRIDGLRVGELTPLLSRRYEPVVDQVIASGTRPGCAAVVVRSTRGLEVRLRLPREGTPVAGYPTVPATPVMVPPRPNFFVRHKPLSIAAALVVAVFMIAAIAGKKDDRKTAAPAAATVTTTSVAIIPTPTVTATHVTTAPPTTTAAPTTPAPTTVVPPPVTTQPPVTQAPPPVAPAPTQPAQPDCHPNYSGCVPIAKDVDCAGGKGNGPAYVEGPITVIGKDVYDLDDDKDGIACE